MKNKFLFILILFVQILSAQEGELSPYYVSVSLQASGFHVKSPTSIVVNEEFGINSVGSLYPGVSLRIGHRPRNENAIMFAFEAGYDHHGFRSNRYTSVNGANTTPQSRIYKDIYSLNQIGVGGKVFFNVMPNKKIGFSFSNGFYLAYNLSQTVSRNTYENMDDSPLFRIRFNGVQSDARKTNLIFESSVKFDRLTIFKGRIFPFFGIRYHLGDYEISDQIDGGFADANGKVNGKLFAINLGVAYGIRSRSQ